MKRKFAIFWAHTRALGFCLRHAYEYVWSNDRSVLAPTLIYVKYSVDETEGKRTRQVGVGFWSRSLVHGVPDRWVDYIIFYQEQFDRETQKWQRTK